ncbi:MAG: hypothetical protein JO353_03230 [Phycisphaerae bacterium]|nr:hypothetical protein [Phycisphaerae bacterium]
MLSLMASISIKHPDVAQSEMRKKIEAIPREVAEELVDWVWGKDPPKATTPPG